jgi:hypothetical protein
MKLTEGATYTISVLARGNANVNLNACYILNAGASNQALTTSWQMTAAWQKFSVTFTADANTGASTGSHLLFRYYGDVVAYSTWFEIQEVKIEAGNKATDWCPDTLDMAFPDTTTIDGGNIKTGKIESHDGNTYFDLDNDEIVMDGGVNGKIVMNPTDGFKLLNSSDDIIGGLAVIDGQIASIAQMLTDSNDPDFYARIGSRSDGTWGNWNGLYGYSYWSDPLGPYDVGFHETIRLESVLSGTATLWSLYNPKYNNIGVYHEKWDMIVRHGYSQVGATAQTAYVRSTSSSTDSYSEICATPDDVKHIWRTSDGTATTTVLPQIQTGTVASVGTAGWSSVSFPVAFPTGSTIKVIATPVTETVGVIAGKIRSESVTGFEITVGGTSISGISFNWVAFSV